MHVLFRGLRFDGGDSIEPELSIDRDGLTGWLKGGVGTRYESVPRSNADGDHDLPVHRTGRRVTLTGLARTDSPSKQDHLIRRITGLMNLRSRQRFVVASAFDTTWADLKVESAECDPLVYGQIARYRIELWSDDPLIFGETHGFAGGEGAFHYGNADAVPVLEVTGVYAAGYTVSAAGKSFVVTQALAAGQTHRIDLATGWLYRNGVLQSGVVGQADTWTIQPGETVTHSLTGSGTLTVSVRDTFM